MAPSWDVFLTDLSETIKDRLPLVKNENLVDFCLRDQRIRNAVEEFLKVYTKPRKATKKCRPTAEEKKEEGNKYYNEKNYEKALSSYTESIFHAQKNDTCLPLAYSNRSMVLQQMGCISECLQDIEMALNCGYPENKSEKLIIRKARCLVQLGDVNKAREILEDALGKFQGKDGQMLKKELKSLDSQVKPSTPTTEFKSPEPVGGTNGNFPYASNHISVTYSKAKGRHVIATEDIQIGDVLFVEEPFAFVTFKPVCDRCCRKLKAPIPCWNCMDAIYCSPECRDEFWKSTHPFECGFNSLFRSVGIAHLSLRIILAASSSFSQLKDILGKMNEPELKEGVVAQEKNDYSSVYNLVTNLEKYEGSDLFQYVMTALLLALFMKNHTNYFPPESTDEDLRLLTTVICRHILQLICNGHAIVDTFIGGSQGKTVLDETEERIGTAIYPSASMMNHSCEPSIINSFYKNNLIVRASKVIRKGEEVFNCYGPHARRMTRKERQEILSKQYFFKCECQACLSKFDIQDVFTALKCENCKGPSIPKEEDSIDMICLNCNHVCGVSTETARKRLEFSALIQNSEKEYEDSIIVTLRRFLNAWLLGREIFYKFHKDLSFAADEVKQCKVARCLVLLKDYKRSIMFLKCSVLSVERRFGSFSIELANEMMKIGAAITNYCHLEKPKEIREIAKQGITYYNRAHEIISLLYGSQHQDLQEIKENQKILEAFL